MGGLFRFVFYAAVFAAAIVLGARKKKRTEKKDRTGSQSMGNRARMMQDKQERMAEHAAGRVTREAEVYAGRALRAYSHSKGTARKDRVKLELEDDRNDWLACQLAEEQKAYREVSEMFEAKLSHLSNCAAENLRLEHVLRCAARKLAEDSRE